MEEILIFWLAFLTVIFVAGMAHFAITQSARDPSRHEKAAVPRGWLCDVERRGWSGEEEGVLAASGTPPPRLPPRAPAEAHVRS